MKLLKLPKPFSREDVEKTIKWIDELTLEEAQILKNLFKRFEDMKIKCDLCDKPAVGPNHEGLLTCDNCSRMK